MNGVSFASLRIDDSWGTGGRFYFREAKEANPTEALRGRIQSGPNGELKGAGISAYGPKLGAILAFLGYALKVKTGKNETVYLNKKSLIRFCNRLSNRSYTPSSSYELGSSRRRHDDGEVDDGDRFKADFGVMHFLFRNDRGDVVPKERLEKLRDEAKKTALLSSLILNFAPYVGDLDPFNDLK